jgi:hypothetical protein
MEQTGACSPSVGVLSQRGSVRRVNTLRARAQTSPSVQTTHIEMSAGGFLPYRGSARPLPWLIYRSLLSDTFKCYELHSHKNKSSAPARRQRKACYKILSAWRAKLHIHVIVFIVFSIK